MYFIKNDKLAIMFVTMYFYSNTNNTNICNVLISFPAAASDSTQSILVVLPCPPLCR